MRTTAALLAALALTGCVTAPVTLAPQTACSTLVGPSLRADVEPVDLPSETATAGDLWTAFDGQSGRLQTSNVYRRAVLEIVSACEERDRVAARRITAHWWEWWKR